MQNTVALVDLQGYSPNIQQLTAMLEQYSTLYLFHSQNQCTFTLTELNELSTLINSGQVIILDLPLDCRQEYQYAVLVGQLLVLLDLELSVALWSAQPQAAQLVQLFQQAGLQCTWQQLSVTAPAGKHSTTALSWTHRVRVALDVLLQPIQNHQLFVNYAPLAVRKGLERLTVTNCDQDSKVSERLQTTQPMATDPIVKQEEAAVQQLRQGIEALIDDAGLDTAVIEDGQADNEIEESLASLHFHPSDQVHFELLRQLQQKQAVMPKDIYLLKDLLSEVFPEADANLMIKALIKRGYIHWNGHEVIYSYEMYLN